MTGLQGGKNDDSAGMGDRLGADHGRIGRCVARSRGRIRTAWHVVGDNMPLSHKKAIAGVPLSGAIGRLEIAVHDVVGISACVRACLTSRDAKCSPSPPQPILL